MYLFDLSPRSTRAVSGDVTSTRTHGSREITSRSPSGEQVTMTSG
jgi:hypothetical protein